MPPVFSQCSWVYFGARRAVVIWNISGEVFRPLFVCQVAVDLLLAELVREVLRSHFPEADDAVRAAGDNLAASWQDGYSPYPRRMAGEHNGLGALPPVSEIAKNVPQPHGVV